MSRSLFVFGCTLLALSCCSLASAKIVEHSFHVQNLTVYRLCNRQVITAVNGSLPGPTLRVRQNDTVIVHVFNKSPYNLTIHWHGIFQMRSGWADGPNMVTQCPITPGSSYTYRFRIVKQEGTLWWHAHASWLRATVYGAIIIRPRHGRSYPFPKPHREFPILLGEWYNGNVVDIETRALATGIPPNASNAYTINGKPGDLYNCSQNRGIHKLKMKKGKRYLMRIINAALNTELFFKIANHNMTVVAVDASYTNHYTTDVVVIAPGQTTDVLVTANQPVGSYYMAASPYASAPNVAFDNTTTRAIIEYYSASSSNSSNIIITMPLMPAPNDTPTAFKFMSNLTGLVGGPHWVPVPRQINEHMFITVGMGLSPCNSTKSTCSGPFGQKFSASMNNLSFVLPTSLSMLQAFFYNVSGVYTPNFPDNPPIIFDYTNSTLAANQSLLFAPKSTSVKKLKYNSTVQIVLQDTALLAVDNHPTHIHGFNFHVLAQGFGNYDPVNDPKKFNFVNPQMRNTIGVPVGGWAVIRFTANNPGVWLLHCHLDQHLPFGLAMAFVVENGGTHGSTLPPPPSDLPKC